MTLSITTATQVDGQVVVSIVGEVDVHTRSRVVETVREVLRNAAPTQLALDLGLVTFIDSTGLAGLVAARKLAQARGCVLTATNPSPFVHRMMEVTGLLDTFGWPEPPRYG